MRLYNLLIILLGITMKKNVYTYLALIIIVFLSFSAAAAGFFSLKMRESEDPFIIAVLSDLHVFAESQIGDPQSEDYQDFDSNGRYLLFSEALLKSATDHLSEGDSDVVFVSGDLTESGTKLSHLAVAAQLEKLVQAGKKVFVIPGNHDINTSAETYENGYEEDTENISPEEFAEIYANYGYHNALKRDTGTLSYTADINDEYRLFAVDVAFYRDDDPTGEYTGNNACLDERLMTWLQNELTQCKTDGKTPIGMMHFPLLSHLGSLLDGFGFKNTKVNNNVALADLLINGGMKYIFTGHLHAQDIAEYQNDEGEIYDIETGALASYPSPMRYFTSDKEEEIISSSVLSKIEEKHLPSYLSSEMRNMMLADLQGFMSSYYDNAMTTAFMKNIDTDVMLSVLNMFGLEESDPQVISFGEELYDIVIHFMNMKLYDKFAEEGEETLESIAALYGIQLPDSKYQSVLHLIFSMLKANSAGDEYAPVGSPENILLKYGVFSIIHLLHSNDIFSKLHALDSSIADIDLSETVQTLFETGGLEVVSNNLIQGIVSSLDMIKDSELSFLVGLNSAGAVTLIDFLFGNSDKIKFGNFKITFSTQLTEYIDTVYDGQDIVSGKIMLGKFIDNELFGALTEDLINDKAPADNILRIKK